MNNPELLPVPVCGTSASTAATTGAGVVVIATGVVVGATTAGGVTIAGGVGVTVGSSGGGVAATQTPFVMLLVSSVTAPVRANSCPCIVAPVVAVMDVMAKI